MKRSIIAFCAERDDYGVYFTGFHNLVTGTPLAYRGPLARCLEVVPRMGGSHWHAEWDGQDVAGYGLIHWVLPGHERRSSESL